MGSHTVAIDPLEHYWATDVTEIERRLGSGPQGLSAGEAAARLKAANAIARRRFAVPPPVRLLWRQVKNPLLMLLVFAAGVAMLTAEWTEAGFVLAIVAITVGIGFVREYQAENAASALRNRIRTKAMVVRDGVETAIHREDVVPGDVVLLSAGSIVPADAVLVEAADLFLRESALTGESFPVEKRAGATPVSAPERVRTNVVYLGTDVSSGTARALAVRTGAATEIGAIARRLSLPAPESDFDRGLRRFGYFVTTAMLMLVILVFAAHVLRGRPAVETLLFSVALAVGLSPELMPAILSVNLARGAHAMARRGVLVRRLNAIENLGSMSVLCTDKTGTLTEGVVRLEATFDADNQPAPAVLAMAALNASLAAGPPNPLDQAIIAAGAPAAASSPKKLGEVPFDFTRRRVSVIVAAGDAARIITKGAVPGVLDVCATAAGVPLDAARRQALETRVASWAAEGTRVVAVASGMLPVRDRYSRDDEANLSFEGFLTFLDRPKPDAARALADLAALNVRVKVITGDHHLVAAHVAGEVGLKPDSVLVGAAIDALDDAALWRVVDATDVFAEVDPNQKERILRALKRNGHVVGFLGDGINDAPAMHIADTSLSVEGAVDVAREAADFVLLERDLDVIRGGIEEGRRTFANTLKYIQTTMSANLGNMISMATASLVLPFLPMTASQILLNNLLSDLPALGIADDNVDASAITRPSRWDVGALGWFMVEFGLVSSAFDVLTFLLLLRVFHAGVPEFQTGWFVESLLTELVVALVIRTAGPALRSRPGTLLLNTTIVVTIAAFAVPFLPGAGLLAFVPLPASMLVSLGLLTAAYALVVEVLKLTLNRRAAARRAA